MDDPNADAEPNGLTAGTGASADVVVGVAVLVPNAAPVPKGLAVGLLLSLSLSCSPDLAASSPNADPVAAAPAPKLPNPPVAGANGDAGAGVVAGLLPKTGAVVSLLKEVPDPNGLAADVLVTDDGTGGTDPNAANPLAPLDDVVGRAPKPANPPVVEPAAAEKAFAVAGVVDFGPKADDPKADDPNAGVAADPTAPKLD